MMDFNERAIPGVSANYLIQESLSRYNFAGKYIQSKAKVLEIGCGSGYGSYHLINEHKSIDLTAIDLDREAIKYAQKKYGKRVKFLVGNAEKLKFAKEHFDIVICFEVIEHLRNPVKLINEAHRVLKLGGVFVVSTPNIRIHSPERIQSPYHEREFTKEEFKHLLLRVFPKIDIYGQAKSLMAMTSLEKYMESQSSRQKIVNSDMLHLRSLLPDSTKEWLWKFIGGFFGRNYQNELKPTDFPVTKNFITKSEYFIAVCKKKRFQ